MRSWIHHARGRHVRQARVGLGDLREEHISRQGFSGPVAMIYREHGPNEVIRVEGERVYRSKGILQIKGQSKRVIFQGVQMMFDARPDRLWNVAERRSSQLVFIGRGLDEARIRRGFAECIAE